MRWFPKEAKAREKREGQLQKKARPRLRCVGQNPLRREAKIQGRRFPETIPRNDHESEGRGLGLVRDDLGRLFRRAWAVTKCSHDGRGRARGLRFAIRW